MPLALALLMLPLAACDDPPTEPEYTEETEDEVEAVTFSDADLAAAVRVTLSLGDAPVMPADLQGLTVLNAPEAEITALGGLEHAVNLEALYLPGNDLGDLSPLAGLTALQTLDLSGNGIDDLSDLAGLTALEHLELQHNTVADLAPLAGLTALRYLDVTGNEVEDIDALGDLTHLEALLLSWNQITDISGLGAGGPTPLALGLTGNQIADLAPLVANTGLGHVGIGMNPLDEEALCDEVPSLGEAGVVVRGAGACPTDPEAPEESVPFITTEQEVHVAGVGHVSATFTNHADVARWANNCGGDTWGFQLSFERRVEESWETVYEPATTTCLSPVEILHDGTVTFQAWGLDASWQTGSYRLVWGAVRVGQDPESELAPMEERVSRAFSIVQP